VTSQGNDAVSPGAVGRSSVILLIGIGGAQAVGLVRELFLATQVGLSGDLDAVLIALALPILAAGVVTGGAAGALIPVYLEAQATNGRDDARRLAGTVIAWIGLAGLILTIATALIAPILITISGPGLRDVDHASAVGYLRVLTPILFVTVISAMMRGICQAEEVFGSIAIATFAGPAATLATMLVLWQSLHLGALVIGSVVGSLANLMVLLVAAARVNAVPIPFFRTDPRLRAWMSHAAPLTLSGGILEIRGIADRAVASLLGPGSVSALRYATVLLSPLAQIGPAWASVIYPRLVQATLGAPGGTLSSWADQMLRYAVAIFIPIAALTAAVAPVAVFVAYGRGAFTPEDMNLTAAALAAYAPGLVTLVMLPVLTGSLNARRRGRVLLIGGAMNVVFNVVLDVVLAFWLGVAGVALAASIAGLLVVGYFIRSMGTSEDSFDPRPLGRTIGLSLLAIAPFGAVIGLLSWGGFGQQGIVVGIVVLAAFGLVGVLGYLVLASAFGMGEARQLARATIDGITRRLPGRRQA
jgi:putative peptidoglycan lipid II flippase